ncbi:MAG: DUF305 domain-containing protein [Pyrinomonadaceae bacterium]|nr:DUF305 domain-containing protein [Pyrinomonadaceae bacterium]
MNAMTRGILFRTVFFLFFALFPAFAALAQSGPVVVRPGAPGQPTEVLAEGTRPRAVEVTAKDVEFMQGMIMHHAQAVEMTALIEERTDNADLRLLGARISQTQAAEIEQMKRWLAVRGFPAEMDMSSMGGDHSHHMGGHMMPGMLTKAQMDRLRRSKGKEFDRLFLEGMIQHHKGALVMVDDLFGTPGAGQDAELFNFATDIDTSQRGEIRIMREMLERSAGKKE